MPCSGICFCGIIYPAACKYSSGSNCNSRPDIDRQHRHNYHIRRHRYTGTREDAFFDLKSGNVILAYPPYVFVTTTPGEGNSAERDPETGNVEVEDGGVVEDNTRGEIIIDGDFIVEPDGTIILPDGSSADMDGDGTADVEGPVQIDPDGKISNSRPTLPQDEGNCPKDHTCPLWNYLDTNAGAWYHDGVHYCIEKGLMVGISDRLFAPNGVTSRAMIATILWRIEGSPIVNYELSFEDVEAGQWYFEAIRWAQYTGVVEGYGDKFFGPNDPITRE